MQPEIYLDHEQGGMVYTIIPLTFGRARLCIGSDRTFFTDGW